MPNVNIAIIAGHVGRDPEIRYTSGGKAVANFTVATSRSWKDNDGNWKKETEWHKITAWNHLAEKAGKLVKGNSVFIRGEIKTSSWEKDGQKHERKEIWAQDLNPIKGERSERQQTQQREAYSPPPPEDDIPF